MSERSEKLNTLLAELFQLDQPDLDFGVHRIMHARSAEVTRFLSEHLLPQVRAAVAQHRPADSAGEAVDLDALEAEAADHLYGFFRRYYARGDFLGQRVHEPGVYAIPSEGEEVTLHWANADQYYVTTGESLRDHFIHKDLGSFLRRELDCYIRNEVVHLDDIESETAARVEQYRSRIRVIRTIGRTIIDVLARLEDFQKTLWLKKKFAVETSWCIRVGCIPEVFLPAIAANDAQREEWVTLCAIDEIEGDLATPAYSRPLTPAFLRAHPTLMVDTRHFGAEFTAQLLEALGDLDERTDGVLVRGENFQALRLMQARYRGRVKVTYIDPPYNTGAEDFPYKDRYRHSTWLAMMRDRLHLGRTLQTQDGTITVSIDDTEVDHLTYLLRETYGDVELAKLVWDRNRKNDARYFSVGHEYMLVYARDREHLRRSGVTLREPKEGIEEARAHVAQLRARHGDDWDTIRREWLRWFESIPVADPRRRLMRYSKVGPRGPYRDDRDISWPGGGGPRYEVLHPHTGQPCRIPSRGWVFPTAERFWQAHGEGRVVFGPDERTVPSLAAFLFESDGQVMPSVFYSYAQTASQEFDAMWGARVFDNPKNWRDLFRVVRYLGESDSLVLDYFAGSGTTGHAVINLNRADGGRRRFIMVELGDHFDTVLLPRLKKVAFSPEWKDGKPKRLATAEEAERSLRVMRVVRLESYEDTLGNLDLRRTEEQAPPLSSLPSIGAFADPTAYQLEVRRPGSDESRMGNVDLVETFNWLIGLTVHHLAAPRTFAARFMRDDHPDLPAGAPRRLLLDGCLREDPNGPWWFRTVTGTTPDGRQTLVVWRTRPGGETPEGIARDNLVLDEWFTTRGHSSTGTAFDLVYVNGTNTLENRKAPGDTWTVRLIEEDFRRLMFEEGA